MTTQTDTIIRFSFTTGFCKKRAIQRRANKIAQERLIAKGFDQEVLEDGQVDLEIKIVSVKELDDNRITVYATVEVIG